VEWAADGKGLSVYVLWNVHSHYLVGIESDIRWGELPWSRQGEGGLVPQRASPKTPRDYRVEEEPEVGGYVDATPAASYISKRITGTPSFRANIKFQMG
jgi:hypothetical protein